MPSVFRALQERKVPRTLLIYIAGSWGVLQAIDFFSNRYAWDDVVVDLALALAISGLPFVVIRTWFSESPEPQKNWRKEFVALSITAVFAIAAVTYVIASDDEHLQPIIQKSIAVLPFRNVSSDQKNQFLAEGLSNEIINRLVMQRDLLVIDKTSSSQLPSDLSSREISTKLHVQYLLTGTVAREGNQLRITTRLEDAEKGTVVSAKSMNRNLTDFFALQTEVTTQVVTDLGLVVSQGLRRYPSTANLRAFEFLQAAGKLNVEERADLLRRATEEDSMCVDAWFGIAEVNLFQFGNSRDSTKLRDGLYAKARIEAIDAEGFTAQIVKLLYTYWVLEDYRAVIEQSDELLESYPYSLPILFRKGLAHRRLGESQEFIDSQLRALKCNPLALGIKREIIVTLVRNGQTVEASELLKDLRNTRLAESYGILKLSCAVLDGDTALIQGLMTEVARDKAVDSTHRTRFRERCLVLLSLYKRDYSSAFANWSSADAFDSAMLYHLAGDRERSMQAFLRARKSYEGTPPPTRVQTPIHDAFYKLRYLATLAAVNEPGWQERIEQARDEMDPVLLPVYHDGRVTAYLLAQEWGKALKALAEWKAANAGYPTYSDLPEPFMIVKDHPLLDQIRNESAFTTLWENNHLELREFEIDFATE